MSRDSGVSKREVWRRRLQEFERGSVSVVEFCRRIGVSKATFYVWRRKVSLASPEASAPGSSAIRFLPVQITGESPRTIEVVLTNGTRVLVPSDDREAVRTVLQAAAEIPEEGRVC